LAEQRTAILYRMVLPEHTCPFGVRAKEQLQAAGFEIEEHILRTREEVDAVQEEFSMSTTPVVIIDGELIGGSKELESYLADQQANA
jgi:glutaredoxin